MQVFSTLTRCGSPLTADDGKSERRLGAACSTAVPHSTAGFATHCITVVRESIKRLPGRFQITKATYEGGRV